MLSKTGLDTINVLLQSIYSKSDGKTSGNFVILVLFKYKCFRFFR